MKNKKNITQVFILCVISLFALSVNAISNDKKMEKNGLFLTVPLKTIGDSNRDYLLSGVDVDHSDGALKLLASVYELGERALLDNMVFASVNTVTDVNNRSDSLITMSDDRTVSSFSGNSRFLKRLVVFGKKYYVVNRGLSSGYDISYFSVNNNAAQLKKLAHIENNRSIAYLHSDDNVHLSVCGNVGSFPFCDKINSQGIKISEFVATKFEEPFTLTNAFEKPKGYLLFGQQKELSDTTSWLGMVNFKGKILKHIELTGGAVKAVVLENKIFVLTKQYTQTGTNLILSLVNSPNFELEWSKKLVSNQHSVIDFDIELIKDGVVVAGSQDRGLWISVIDHFGEALWTKEHIPKKLPDYEMVTDVDLVVHNDQVNLAYGAFIVEKRVQRAVVKLLKLVSNK